MQHKDLPSSLGCLLPILQCLYSPINVIFPLKLFRKPQMKGLPRRVSFAWPR